MQDAVDFRSTARWHGSQRKEAPAGLGLARLGPLTQPAVVGEGACSLLHPDHLQADVALVAQTLSPDLFDYAKDLFVEANDEPLAPPHCWLTNRTNNPAAINKGNRIPTTNEPTQCRCSVGFDPALFCAAPRPNQKGRLPMVATRRLAFRPIDGMAPRLADRRHEIENER
jgi:hypothetical protein